MFSLGMPYNNLQCLENTYAYFFVLRRGFFHADKRSVAMGLHPNNAVSSCRKTKRHGIQTLILSFFLHDLRDLTSVNKAQLFQFPLIIQRVPATLARLNG